MAFFFPGLNPLRVFGEIGKGRKLPPDGGLQEIGLLQRPAPKDTTVRAAKNVRTRRSGKQILRGTCWLACWLTQTSQNCTDR